MADDNTESKWQDYAQFYTAADNELLNKIRAASQYPIIEERNNASTTNS